MVYGDEPRRVEVGHLFEGIREPECEPPVAIGGKLTPFNPDPLVRVRLQKLSWRHELAEHAGTERIGDELETGTVPREERRAGIDVEERLLEVERAIGRNGPFGAPDPGWKDRTHEIGLRLGSEVERDF